METKVKAKMEVNVEAKVERMWRRKKVALKGEANNSGM